MKTWIMWHGGPSYACPSVEDAEEFSTLDAAREEFKRRERGCNPRCPCVEDSSAHVFFTDPSDCAQDPYPDRVFGIGPKGGFVESPA